MILFFNKVITNWVEKFGSAIEKHIYITNFDNRISFVSDTKLRHGPKGQDVQYFRFSDKVMRSKLLKAQLWMYLRGTHYQHGSRHSHEEQADAPAPESPGGGYDGGGGGGSDGGWSVPLVNISVLKVLRGSSGSSESPVMKIEAKSLERRPSGRGGWVSVNVEELLTKWFENPKDNHGVVLHATDERDRQIVVTDHKEEDGALVPFVELYTADGRKHRTKRTIGLNCDETSEETRCCRYPLTVDFEEFGWDWIIAPKKYEANYCSGECPYVFLQKYPHTHIVALANPSGTAGPCCAPRKMSPISMLYFDNEYNIIYGLLPGMVVDRCGCS
ncbi:Growth/differentiation factor 8 [Blattella germanica]|nr:Growth/differentiation factor 8 [Blattella germanica]